MCACDEEVLTVEEIAAILKPKSPRWVEREGPKYDLPLYKVGRDIVGFKSEIIDWLKQQRHYA